MLNWGRLEVEFNFSFGRVHFIRRSIMLSNRLRAIVGAMALLFWTIPAVADVCYLPNSNCGLLGPEEKGPVPVPDDDKNKCPADYVKDCPRINTNLQKYVKKDGCCRAVCRYESFSDCVTNSSTNYCELDEQTQCYKQAVAPVTCVDYNDTAEKAQDPNCDCEQCEDDTTRYKCECVEPTPETCKSYGESLTPPKIYDTESSLVCGSNQKKQSIDVIKNDKTCYQCVNKTCEDYGKKDKGQCGNGFREVDDTAHPGCVECVPQQVENNEICFKLNYTCNGKTCSDTYFNKFMKLINNGGLKVSSMQYPAGIRQDNDLYCLSKELFISDNRVLSDDDEYMPESSFSVIDFKFNLSYSGSDYSDKYSVYKFKGGSETDKNKSYTTSYELSPNAFIYENDIYYIKNNSGYDCDEIYTNYIGIDNEKVLACYQKAGYEKLTSNPVNLNIELFQATGEYRCIYFTATCPKLKDNGEYPGYCIDRINGSVIDSKETDRIGNIAFNYQRATTDSDTANVQFDFGSLYEITGNDSDSIKFKICGVGNDRLKDWDVVNITVKSNIYSDIEGKGSYLYAPGTTECQPYKESGLCDSKEYTYNITNNEASANFVPFNEYTLACSYNIDDKQSYVSTTCQPILRYNRKQLEYDFSGKFNCNFSIAAGCSSNCYTSDERDYTFRPEDNYNERKDQLFEFTKDTVATQKCYRLNPAASACEVKPSCSFRTLPSEIKTGLNAKGYYNIISKP